ncbi:hypothetical protein JW872_01720 [Candidatus Babeliales bacterium]|nr:hypothetical protein [Candidatus Babeliales bacterium]
MKRIFIISCVVLGCLAQEDSFWINRTLAAMTTHEKVAQLVMPAIPYDPDAEGLQDQLFTFKLPDGLNRSYAEHMVKEYGVGGFLLICEVGSVCNHAAFANHLQSLSRIPLLFAQDFEPGKLRHPELLRLPLQMTLGALKNEQLIYEVGEVLGTRARRLGVHIIFAPVADVNNNPHNPVIGMRSFGDQPGDVARKAHLLMEGIRQHAIPVMKHVPGHGDTTVDSHLGLPKILHSRGRLESIEFVPFKYLIANGIDAAMTAHIVFSELDADVPVTLSRKVIRSLLRGEWGFKGALFSDALNMHALTEHYSPEEIALKAYHAGNTVLVFPTDVPRVIQALVSSVESGAIMPNDLDERVRAVLRLKARCGLDRERYVTELQDPEELNTHYVRTLKQRLYSQAVTCIGNRPVAQSDAQVLCIGSAVPFSDTMNNAGHIVVRVPAYSGYEEQVDTFLAKGDGPIVIALSDMTKFPQSYFGLDQFMIININAAVERRPVHVVLFGSPYAASFFDKKITIIQAFEDDADAQIAAAQVLLGKCDVQGRMPVEL